MPSRWRSQPGSAARFLISGTGRDAKVTFTQCGIGDAATALAPMRSGGERPLDAGDEVAGLEGLGQQA